MKLQEKYYRYIQHGTKNIEIRLNDEKRQKIKVNDHIIFTNISKQEEKIKVRVIELLKYTNFKKMFENHSIEELADKEMTKEELLEVLEQFYTKDEQEKYGVLGIKIEKIEV